MPSGPEKAFSNCVITCTIIGTTGNSEKLLRNRYSMVFGAAKLYSGIRITQGCTRWLCGGCAGSELGRNGSVHENHSKIVTHGFLGMPNSILALELPGGTQRRLCGGIRGGHSGGEIHSPWEALQTRYSGVFGDAEFNSSIRFPRGWLCGVAIELAQTYRAKMYAEVTNSKKVDLARIIPTANALTEHIKRIYFQIQAWYDSQGQDEALESLEWGWALVDGELSPVTMTQETGP
ncbi:unnamed protein product [Psylliodes chrysocephalus]|uniref:Uncharacterized protein n=1 Tax=Psylliodes chrysocephalus TaxID=3402493 RepID=A0A9P0GBY6_9CUCU|nr:unnamed protein product [Psylliodes chrysocephala]